MECPELLLVKAFLHFTHHLKEYISIRYSALLQIIQKELAQPKSVSREYLAFLGCAFCLRGISSSQPTGSGHVPQSRRHQFHFTTKPVLKLARGNQGKIPRLGGHLQFLFWLSSRLTPGWSELYDCVRHTRYSLPIHTCPSTCFFSSIPSGNQYCWWCQECLLLTKAISSLKQQVSSHCWQLGYKLLSSVKLPASSTAEISRSDTAPVKEKKKRDNGLSTIYVFCN